MTTILVLALILNSINLIINTYGYTMLGFYDLDAIDDELREEVIKRRSSHWWWAILSGILIIFIIGV